MSSAFDRVRELTRELGIAGPVELAMLTEPERAVAVLEYARRARHVRSPAALAIARWRAGFDPRPVELEPPVAAAGPPTLAAIEHAWSLEPAPFAGLLLRCMAFALERAGGFAELQRQLQRFRVAEAGGADAP